MIKIKDAANFAETLFAIDWVFLRLGLAESEEDQNKYSDEIRQYLRENKMILLFCLKKIGSLDWDYLYNELVENPTISNIVAFFSIVEDELLQEIGTKNYSLLMTLKNIRYVMNVLAELPTVSPKFRKYTPKKVQKILDDVLARRQYIMPDIDKDSIVAKLITISEDNISQIWRDIIDIISQAWRDMDQDVIYDSKSLFLSYSSKDRPLAHKLATALTIRGVNVWLDEWQIKVGDSITCKIQEGIKKSRYLAVLLTPNSVNSRWVEREWQSAYHDEISGGNVVVLPVLGKRCKIPALLRDKRYADLTHSFDKGVEAIIERIQ